MRYSYARVSTADQNPASTREPEEGWLQDPGHAPFIPLLLLVLGCPIVARGDSFGEERRALLENSYHNGCQLREFDACLNVKTAEERERLLHYESTACGFIAAAMSRHNEPGDIDATTALDILLERVIPYVRNSCPGQSSTPNSATNSPQSRASERAARTALPPPVLHVCLAHCSTLYLTTDHRGYDVSPNQLSSAAGTVGLHIRQFDAGGVIIDRIDPPNRWFPKGLKAVITGSISSTGERLEYGKITWTFGQPGMHSVLATWGKALQEIPGSGDSPMELAEPPGDPPR